MTQPAVDCVLDVRAPLGECPVWCERRQALYWIDVYDGKLNRFDPASGGNRVWRFSEPLGSIALCEDDAVLVALKSGLYRYDLASEALTPLASPERERPDNRMNDGRCDAAGRFWSAPCATRPTPRGPTAHSIASIPTETARRWSAGSSLRTGSPSA